MDDLFLIGLVAVCAVTWVRLRYYRLAARARLGRMRELEKSLAEERRNSAHWYVKVLELKRSQEAVAADGILGAETIE